MVNFIAKFENSKLTPDLINQNLNLYNKLIQINEQIEIYLSKNWDVDDIIIRLDSGDSKIHYLLK